MAAGDKFVTDLATTYKDFCKAQNLIDVGTQKIDEWVESLRVTYQNQINMDYTEVMRFFNIPDTDEYRAGIINKNYKVTVTVSNHDVEKKIITYHCELLYGGSIALA